ncbi:type II secretion system protein J [Haloferula chungangensis]|uniref:Type II secretion system protein J n=1 Tax=Haloferula chungangensis TaxID=1048331 RepID=A0ABW2L9Q9_9BACT
MRRAHGFTLLEILASTAIGTIVLLLGVAALSTTGNEYGRSTDGVAAEREARAILTLVAEDLSKAWGFLEMDESSAAWRTDKLGFTCLQAADAQAVDEAVGDLCLVHYYVKDLEIGRETVRCLMRGFRSSDVVFDALRNDTVDQLYEERTVDEPVAFGVISFEVDGLIRQSGGSWKVWDKKSDDPFAEKPDAVRMKLVVARRELVGKLRTTADWDSSPLIGRPADVDQSRTLEIYEMTHPIGHAD